MIYDQRDKKLNFIKEYMAQEKVSYEEAAHIVNQIEGPKQNKKTPVKVTKTTESNEEALLIGRKMPFQRKPLEVRHFVFID